MKEKDIYQLLNDLDFDESEVEDIEISEFDKAKVKKEVKMALRKKRKRHGWKMKVVAAVVIGGLSVSALGIAFPAYAGNVPVIGDIFRFLDNGRTGIYDNYQEYSSTVNMTKESNGVTITINDAIYDGKTVLLTYSIESEKDLGDQPFIGSYLDIKNTSGGSGSDQISKVGKNQYVGLITGSRLDEKDLDTVKVKWRVDSISIGGTEEKIKGTWNFSLSLQASDNEVQLVDQGTEQNGVTVNVDKITVTPMSFIVYYDQLVSKEVLDKWHGVDVEIDIQDDLGNHYAGDGNGGFGQENHIHWSKTFKKLDPDATKLIITPTVRLVEYTPENHGGVEITADGETKAISIPTKEGKGTEEFQMDDIVVELVK
ncbi:DUF4179 domain-containing protein [Sporosarcina sp. ACRSL]|uniref:DUF4179 domain-containing protein n=1 Tax=Sporosarcina sp. ACRSL TaxID=2918215 RepID=UPI001EF502EC|nr:DUF4179 domain-containing protein [Sporosarcina sp. ACRSL]MCG7343753.1 DUF4179 domain-containing protein [Sporosarcina sp. ACRSL]